MRKNRHVIAALLAGTMGIIAPSQAWAQDGQSYPFDMPSQDLGDALRSVAARAGWELYAQTDDVNGKAAPALRGSLTAREAIERLLQGTNLEARFDKGAVIIRGRSEAPIADTHSPEADIVVTGSLIRGVPPAATVTTVTADDIRDAGQNDLGEVARALPQNFGGGQNPGLNNAGGGANQNANVNGASTFNLRGIGPNATLTLLNGHRMSYSGTSAAIDISTIPVAAVDRVEIVADGSSAIYGADAVAGVVNVILKPDYSGAYTSARIGGSTDGGNFEQQFAGVAGARWDSGGLIATYDFFRNTAILAADRTYASTSNPATTLYPKLLRQSFLLSGHQEVGGGIRFSADVAYKTGEMYSASGYLPNRPVDYQGVLIKRTFATFGIAPTIELALPGRWTAKITGFYGTDDTGGLSRFFSAGRLSRTTPTRYDNEARSVEVSAQGPLFRLPGGDVRLAVGAGVRKNSFTGVLPTLTVDRNRSNRFAYAELFVPLASPDQNIGLLTRASISGAVRVEDYSDSDRIATPKLGLIYQPFKMLTLRASWGRSFKVPTLYQQYAGYAAVLLPATGYGSSFPANATLVYALGANDKTQAERSENLTLSAEFKPVRDFSLSLSYFNIDYTDRVAAPLASYVGALTNPLYASFITSNPTAAQIDALVAGATQVPGLQNATGRPYDPTQVVAILDGRDRNIARQKYRGVDVAFRYRIAIDSEYDLLASGAATWLDSKQVLLPGQTATPLAGRIFNPPHFKARAGLTFSGNGLSISSFVSYAGGVTDARRATSVDVGSMTTLDLTGRLKFGGRNEIAISALNLFNAKPETIYTSSTTDAPFDNTNYSAIGRYIGVTVSRSW